jgi:hypothetical protein
MSLESETILSRRVVPQPSPGIVPAGDCGACVLAGLLDISPAAAYELVDGRPPRPLAWPSMELALCHARDRGLLDRNVAGVPFWHIYDGYAAYGAASWNVADHWFEYVLMAADAGYYGVAHIESKGQGPGSGADHWVLICGARSHWVDTAVAGTKRLETEIFVSCSATCVVGMWHETERFLRTRGGYNVLLARPSRSASAPES